MAAKTGTKQVTSLTKEDLGSTLAELQKQVGSSLGNPTTDQMAVAGTTVVKSPILMPDGASLQAGVNMANVARAEKHGDLDPQLAANIESLKDAIGHSQIIRSAPSSVNRDGQTVNMPSDVRDIPNRLYWFVGRDRQTHFIREKADKLMSALLGGKVDVSEPTKPIFEDLAGSVAIVAGSRGFTRDPLVWASQILWENINYDYPHDYDSFKCPEFDNMLDEHPESPILQAMRLCFSFNEVRQITRLARFHNKTSLGILRKIFMDVCAKHNMPVPPPVAQDWKDEEKVRKSRLQ
jgi:hypothetical protein